MSLSFVPVAMPDDAAAAVAFLTSNEWPFHGSTRLAPDAAAAVVLVSDEVASFWIRDGDRTVGMARALDLDDLADGSPLLDIRIAESHRGRGIGTAAVTWITDHLFGAHPELHRIEATTRGDNVAMQRVFDRCGYRCEGRMLEAWAQADGTRFDSLTYAILRREHDAARTLPTRPTTAGPELYAAEPLGDREGGPVGRVIVPPDRDPDGPAFFEWQLRGQEWSDEHDHDEWVYVLDGELHVEADGVQVVAGPGALVRVPAGSRGTYSAPVFARLLSVYGPRPPHPADPRGVLRDLDG